MFSLQLFSFHIDLYNISCTDQRMINTSKVKDNLLGTLSLVANKSIFLSGKSGFSITINAIHLKTAQPESNLTKIPKHTVIYEESSTLDK